MITLYTKHSNQHGREVVERFLNAHHVQYQKVALTHITRDIVYSILKISREGFDSIISKQSSEFKENLSSCYSEMLTHELVDYIVEHPNCLKMLAVKDEHFLVTDFNEQKRNALIGRRV
jgi:arsenate reductase-like glutaredoxin family protein